jgi:Type II secretion system protein B
MSFIHEALKRSDRARRVLGASRLEPADATLAPPRRSRWLPLIVVLLLANVALLAWFTWAAFAPQPVVEPAPQYGGEVRSLEREAGTTDARPTPAAPGDAGAAAALDAMPPELQARMPPLHLDAHAWSEDPAQRFVIINLKRRVAGDALDGGVTLVEITADGVIVEFEGRRATIARQ